MDNTRHDESPLPDDESAEAPESDEECDATVTISPPEEKVGEGEGNLEKREEWFRKRSR